MSTKRGRDEQDTHQSAAGGVRPSYGVRLLRLAIAAAGLVTWLALASAPASALATHQLISSFDGSDAPNGPYENILADAVDNSSGPSSEDVYVGEEHGDIEEHSSAVDKYDANGVYLGLHITGAETPDGSFALFTRTTHQGSGIAVDGSGSVNVGDLYVADIEHGVIDKFDESGTYVCQITGRETPSLSECDGITGSQTPQGGMEPRGVAVDSSGNVYVADAAGKVVDEFDAAGEYLRQISDSHIVNPGSIAVDSKGNLFVNNGPFEGFNVVRFDAAGLFVEELDGELTESVAVDPARNHILLGEEAADQIAEFDAEGRRLDTFGRFGLVIAVDGSTSRIYSNSLSGLEAIEIHGPLRVVPDVTTGSATNVQDASAVLNGRVDPDASHGGGEITACEFEYGTSTSYGQSAPCSPPTPYSSGTDVSATVSVAPDTVYHFRLKAANANVNGGSNVGEDMTF